MKAAAFVLTFLIAITVDAAAQAQPQRPLTGNPTPGTPQPDPPNLADRISLTGCLQYANPKDAGATVDQNTPIDSRYVLTSAKRETRVLAGTGTSSVATAPTSGTYRLAGIDSVMSPFVGMRVELSGQIETQANAADASNKAPTLRVEFVQKLASKCS